MNKLEEKKDLFLTHTPSLTAKENFFYVQHIGHQFADQDYKIERTNMQSFVLQITLQGQGHLTYRGREYEIKPGYAMLIDCRDYHMYCINDCEEWQFKWLHFDGCSSKGYFELIYEKLGSVFDLKGNQFAAEIIDFLCRQILDRDINFEVNASVALQKLLSQILTLKSASFYFSKSVESIKVKTAIEFMENHFTEDIKMGMLSELAGYSEYHFYRVFKNATGFRPHEYLIKYRINKSKYFLKTTSLSIGQIAEEVGFENACNYITTFKKLENMTPLKYRNSVM